LSKIALKCIGKGRGSALIAGTGSSWRAIGCDRFGRRSEWFGDVKLFLARGNLLLKSHHLHMLIGPLTHRIGIGIAAKPPKPQKRGDPLRRSSTSDELE
jgi:hypothetical protein